MRNAILMGLVVVIASGVAWSQDLTLDAQGRFQDDVLMDLLLDWQEYEGKSVEIVNMYYTQIGVRNYGGFWQNHSWFNGARQLHPTSFMHTQHIPLLLKPPADDRESQRWVMQMSGQYLVNPARVSMVVTPLRHTLNTGLELNLIIIESMTVNDQRILGTLPPRLTQ